MTLAELRASVANILGVTEASFSVSGVNLLHNAINTARKYAEGHHDWEQNKVLARLQDFDEVAGGLWTGYSALGAQVTMPDIVEPTITYIAQTLIEVGELNDDETGIIPGVWLTYDELVQRERAYEGSERDPDVRYPATDGPTYLHSDVNFIVRGTRILQNPAGTAGTARDIGLYIVRRRADYLHSGVNDESAKTDFYLDQGGMFMLWQTVLELNFINKTFVPRQEGNLSIRDVIQMRNEAWDSWVRQDTFQFNKTPQGHL